MSRPPTRPEVEWWWRGVIDGHVSREAAHEWAEPLMFAAYADQPDMMVMTALQYLHGFDLTFTPPNRNLVRHGPPGDYLRSTQDIADELGRWLRDCAEHDRDPQDYRRRLTVAAKAAVDAEAARAQRRMP